MDTSKLVRRMGLIKDFCLANLETRSSVDYLMGYEDACQYVLKIIEGGYD